MNLFQKFWWRTTLRRKTNDDRLVQSLMDAGIVADYIERKGAQIHVRVDDGVVLRLPDERELFGGLHDLRTLRANGATFQRGPAGEFHVAIGGVIFQPDTAEELFIIREVFIDGCYNLKMRRPTVVLDIGGNVGTAALWFSRQEQVVHVHSFEPLVPNIERFERHLRLNATVASKCSLHPVGLGDRTTTLELDYLPSNRGSFSLSRTPIEVSQQRLGIAAPTQKARVRIESAALILERIWREHPGCEFVAKIDCEGAEEPILQNLAQTGRLRGFRALLLETHFGNGSRIASLLSSEGFELLHLNPTSSDLGLIFAFNASPLPPTS